MNNVCNFFEWLNLDEQVLSVKNNLDYKKSVSLSGMGPGEKAYILHTFNKRFIYVASDLVDANLVKKTLCDFGKKVQIIYSSISSPLLTIKNTDEVQIDFMNKIYSFINGEIDGLIVLTSFLPQRLCDEKTYIENQFEIKVDETLDLKQFQKILIGLGFSRTEGMFGVGEFSVHGDVVDICCGLEDEVIRIEFFDDVVEKIKVCDKTSMALKETRSQFFLHPLCAFYSKKQDKIKIKDKLLQVEENYLTGQNAIHFNENITKMIEFSEENNNYPSFLQPFLENFDNSILNAFQNVFVCFDELQKIKNEITQISSEFYAGFESLISGGEITKSHYNFLLGEDEIFKNVDAFLSFQNIFLKSDNYSGIKLSKSQVGKYIFDYAALCKDLKEFRRQKRYVVLFAGGKSECESIKNFMHENNMYFDDFSAEKQSGIFISPLNLSCSIGFVEPKFIAISTPDLIKKSVDLSIKNKTKVFYLPKIGDYVVHSTHGIGKCVGIEKLKLTSCYKDYFIIEYKGGDRLYVPSEQANSISCYLGGESEPKLNKIGGLEFRKAKEKVFKSVQEMAGELVKLYSARKERVGHAFSPDGYLQKAFEDAFKYDETDDQIIATAEIKKDMQSNKIMERLLCGDVGFGKTEVALRAAYKAIIDGKQVAFLCPTTILSQQHYNTCKERFKEFMCNVEVLNRFKSVGEQKDILKRLNEGKIDIICGTHRLLGQDVIFKDLGLLILDEEQRFGVADKEKIKKAKSSVDVLSLSATPIPRTLHMSLSGIRDISIISTPPKERLPVQTFVTEFSPMLLKDACQKELARGGQVLVIYNRVEKINQFASFMRELLPSASIGVAHGQMEEKQLEKAIFDLYEGKYQIFVSTTLIENGIDLPMANTLFVVDSDKLGLAQLYQLRGRIGRGSRLAYSYFTFDASKQLTEQAYKRLEAIMQFSELGSGFKIAMRDLEIRGAGNVLGKEQHGQMQKVGYDLYCKILSSAIKQMNGEKVKEERDVKLDIAYEAYMDPDFIGEEELRIKVYNSISELKNVDEMKAFVVELENSFGKLDTPSMNLIKIAVIKNLAIKADVSKIIVKNREFSIAFYEKEKSVDPNIVTLVSNFSKFCVLKFAPAPIIEVNCNLVSNEQKLDFLLTLLSQI